MKRILLITTLCLVQLCTGCGRQPRIGRLTADSVILAFGDSLTEGSGAAPAESYPARLAERTGFRVVNAGASGETTIEGLRRFPDVLKKEKPDLVILCHGGNDMLRKYNPATTEQNLRAMISMAKESGADIILIAVPKPGIILKPFGVYKKLAEEFRLPLDEKSLSRILQNPAFTIHPNGAGYNRFAETLADLIRKSQRQD
jgi:lysophospholipase L1-like esterase